MVGDVVCVLSCEVLIFSQTASEIPLQCLQPIRWGIFVPDSNNIQVWLGTLRCTPFHEVNIAYVSFVLGMKPSVVQYLGLSRTNAL